MAGGANPSNVNQAASQGLYGAMGRVGQGMTGTAAQGMGAYQNPYEQAVVNKTLRDVGGAAQMGMNTLDAQAGAANAFGGSRHGIAQAEMMKGYQQQAMDKVGALRQQGFNTALGASQADLSRQLGAAGQLGGLANQAFNTGQAISNQQMQQGALQRALNQQLMNAGKAQFGQYAQQPTQGLQTFMGGSRSAMPQMGGKQSYYNAGLMDYLMAAGQFA